MASLELLLFGGVFALIGFLFVVAGVNGVRKWRTMRRVDPTDRVLEPGLREFEGRARATGAPVTTPFTGSRSLVCKYEVERYDHDDDGSNWDTVTSGTEAVPFEIEGTGSTIAVDPEGADYLLTEEFRIDTRDTNDLPPRVREFADTDLGTGSTFELGPIEIGGRRYRFTEERLDEGEAVYVLGRAERGSVPAGSDARLAVAPGDRNWRRRLLGDPFVVSDTGEKAAERRQLKRAAGFLLFGLVFAGFGLVAVVFG